MKSIKWKLIAMYLGLVLIVMIVSGTYILMSLKNIEINRAKNQMKLYAQKISEQVALSFSEDQFQSGLEQFSFANSGSQIQGNILKVTGETIASTTTRTPPYPTFKSSAIISAMSGDAAFDNGGTSNGSEEKWMGYGYPVVIYDEVKYIIYTQMDMSAINESLGETSETIIFAVLLALLLTGIMGYIFSKTLTEPILILTDKAKDLAEGNLEQKVVVYSNDEIGQLSASFNYMSTRLAKTLAEISKEKNKFEIILHNMTDGILSFNKNGEIIHVNSASLEMLGKDEIKGSFTEFIKEFDISSGVYLDMGPSFSKEVTFPVEDKYIKAVFTAYANEKHELEGLIIVLQDITEQKKLDDMRKEFVANVSHELRTPLTTVKSYTETLLEGAIDDKTTAMEFLEIINSETDRMAFLVRDLLQLSRFDNKQIKLNLSRINVKQLIEENIYKTRIHAENKAQRMEALPIREDLFITADKDRINQVLNNIITNAIKYSLKNADIKIFVTEDDNYVKITVKDTGMGISREDIARIFERFYRVDKARSRAMGGTGLGLAIAKDIMELHGGKITAESEYGKGTSMILWFLKELPKELFED